MNNEKITTMLDQIIAISSDETDGCASCPRFEEKQKKEDYEGCGLNVCLDEISKLSKAIQIERNQ
jgi:hypothetical protein